MNLLPLARLSDFRLLGGGDDAQLEWRWRYPNLAILSGFRIYQDGELVVDENTLGNDARSWLTDVFSADESAGFQIEAVAIGGIVSARGPVQHFVPVPPPGQLNER